jgi:DNA-binding response OmpR family regulator
VTKPFSLRELLARIKVILRRTAARSQGIQTAWSRSVTWTCRSKRMRHLTTKADENVPPRIRNPYLLYRHAGRSLAGMTFWIRYGYGLSAFDPHGR